MTLDLEKEFKEGLEKNKDKDMSQFIMEHASDIAQAEKIAQNLMKGNSDVSHIELRRCRYLGNRGAGCTGR